MFKDFPNLHPLVVHFPIVLILLGAALQAVLVFKDWPPVRWITLGIMAGGFAGALAASTVFHAMPMGLSPQVADVFSDHEKYASYALWLSGITLLLGGVGEFFQLRRRAFDVLVLVSALAAAGAVSVAGHHGAQLVYIAGVGPQGHLVMKGHHHEHGAAEAMPGMEMDAADAAHDDGDHDEHSPTTAPAAAGQPAASNSNMADMPGMTSSHKTASPAKTAASMPGMSGMNMPAPEKASRPVQPSSKSGMSAMPGMNMPGRKKQPSMPKGMDMNGSNNQPAMSAMPGMKGMDMRPASKKKTSKATPAVSDMGNMSDMPGMAMPGGQQPKPNAPPTGDMKNMPGMKKGQAMPGMGSMPGMSMPNPMDKYHFEDNNPAREQPKKDH